MKSLPSTAEFDKNTLAAIKQFMADISERAVTKEVF